MDPELFIYIRINNCFSESGVGFVSESSVNFSLMLTIDVADLSFARIVDRKLSNPVYEQKVTILRFTCH